MRALAVLTVMADHFSNDVPDFPLPDWIHLGSTGVRLFLVLSGYFITASESRPETYQPGPRLAHFIGAASSASYLRMWPLRRSH
ncbi:MAG: hypothetical protein ABI217_00320 [Chthoniobacterales bacterium]